MKRSESTSGVNPDFGNSSGPQRKVTQFLMSLGLVVESEVKIGVYRVDIYLPELKTVVEVDGGRFLHHYGKSRERRDRCLEELGVTEVIHVTDLSRDAFRELARKVGA